MRIAGQDAPRLSQDAARLSKAVLALSGASLFALASFASSACAGEQGAPRDQRCASLGEGFPSESVDSCFKAGTHVRVDTQVMQGSARMSGALPFTSDGAAPAAMRSGGATTRLRMRPMPGDVFAR